MEQCDKRREGMREKHACICRRDKQGGHLIYMMANEILTPNHTLDLSLTHTPSSFALSGAKARVQQTGLQIEMHQIKSDASVEALPPLPAAIDVTELKAPKLGYQRKPSVNHP